jgi:cytochrome d ubiquinol oxidase subunit I
MDATALLLSRLQFAFTISFHVIFPAFTIGLAAWLTVLEALRLYTGRHIYRVIFEFWLKIFGVAFATATRAGIVRDVEREPTCASTALEASNLHWPERQI